MKNKLCIVTSIIAVISGCSTQQLRNSASEDSPQIAHLPVQKNEQKDNGVKAKSVVKMRKSRSIHDNLRPLPGFYEAQISFPAGGEPGWTSVVTAFKWLRLYKNGTYTTSQSKHGKIEGRWTYNVKAHTITWKNRYTELDAITDKHEIWNNLKSDCQREGNLYLIYWTIRNASQYGNIYLVWKKP